MKKTARIAGVWVQVKEHSVKHERLDPAEHAPLRSRSREHRSNVTLPAHILLENGEISSVEVLDLSYDGCSVDTPIELREGASVKLTVSGLGSHDAQVRWSADGKAGLAFAVQEHWDREYVPRNCERIELTANIALRRAGRQHYRARVFDISTRGCKVEFVERPRLDELIWVKFEGLDAIEAEVCWKDGFHGGVKFLRPIYPPVFDMLLARLNAGEAD